MLSSMSWKKKDLNTDLKTDKDSQFENKKKASCVEVKLKTSWQGQFREFELKYTNAKTKEELGMHAGNKEKHRDWRTNETQWKKWKEDKELKWKT